MKNILLISHHAGTPGGPPDKFDSYLKKKYKIFKVLHPVFVDRGLLSSIQCDDKIIRFKIFPYFQYVLEGFYTLFYLGRVKRYKKIDLAICFDSLGFFHIYLLRYLLRVKKIVFYNVDYSRTRFNNKIMNFVYRSVNIFSYKKCNYFFSLTKQFTDDIDPGNKFSHKKFYVKSVVDLKSINFNSTKINNSLVHAGSINYNMDFDSLLIALDRLKREGCSFIFDIYGAEKPNEHLLKKIAKLNLKRNISFKGIINNRELVNEILPCYTIGVCPYMTKANLAAHDHMFLGSDLTAKIVDYIASGLPVITTRVNYYFDEIEKNSFGYLVRNEDEWYKAIKNLFFNPTLYKKYQGNALKFAKYYNEKTVLDPIFKEIFRTSQ